MLILFGFKTVLKDLFSAPGTCRYCHREALQRMQERASKFTVFFIPVFTTRKRYQIMCSFCGGTTEVSRLQKDAMASRKDAL